jgi:S1-C subfamily serine protease
MHGLALALAMLVSCGACTSPLVVAPGPEIPVTAPWRDLGYEAMADRTVQITRSCGGWGSGVIIGEGIVATAKHVIDEENCLYFVDGEVAGDKRLHPKKDVDVGLLYFDASGPLPRISYVTPFSTSYLGQPTVVMGYPYDKRARRANFTVSRGHVLANYTDEMFRTSAHVLPGSSGGPVFTEDGYLIGLVVELWRLRHDNGSVMPFDGHYYATPVKFINDILKEQE